VENYLGRQVNDVRLELQTISAASTRPLVTLKEPFMYEYSNEPAGAILRQNPPQGTPISGPLQIELVVSRGHEQKRPSIPKIMGMSAAQALETANQAGVKLVFAVKPVSEGQTPETVVYQNPPAGASANTSDDASANQTTVYADLAAPSQLADDEAFGLYSYTIPEGPAPIPLKLEAGLPDGSKRLLASTNFSGGNFTFPYRLPRGSTLILSALGRDIDRQTVGKK
jgi:hypothetical protein